MTNAQRGLALLTVAVTGALSAAAVHHGCFHSPPPVSVPDPGTARARYCSAVIPEQPWIMMVLLPFAAIVVGALTVCTQRALGLCALILCLILIVKRDRRELAQRGAHSVSRV